MISPPGEAKTFREGKPGHIRKDPGQVLEETGQAWAFHFFPGAISKASLTLEMFLMCFVRILDDNPITRISQQLFTGLNSLFFL